MLIPSFNRIECSNNTGSGTLLFHIPSMFVSISMFHHDDDISIHEASLHLQMKTVEVNVEIEKEEEKKWSWEGGERERTLGSFLAIVSASQKGEIEYIYFGHVNICGNVNVSITAKIKYSIDSIDAGHVKRTSVRF